VYSGVIIADAVGGVGNKLLAVKPAVYVRISSEAF